MSNNTPNNMPAPTKQDHLLRFTLLLLFLFLFFGGLYITRQLLIPVSFAAVFAMLLQPISHKLERWGLHRGIAGIICIFIILLTIAILISLLTKQIIGFSEDAPQLQEKVIEKFDNLQSFIEQQTGVTSEKQIKYMRDNLSGVLSSARGYITGVLGAITGGVTTFAIVLVYIFFFLYYRDKFKRFVMMISPNGSQSQAAEITSQVSRVTQQYLSGVLTVIVVLSIMNSVGLLIVGVKHAVFFGVLAAMLNLIPYIGVMIGSLLPIMMTLLTSDSLTPTFGVIGVFVASQFIENNFLTPNIVGSKVQVNPLATIMALLIGGSLWGVAGMVLFIPFLGIAKIVFDNVESLQPYGFLVGDESGIHEGKKETFWDKIKGYIGMKKEEQQNNKDSRGPEERKKA